MKQTFRTFIAKIPLVKPLYRAAKRWLNFLGNPLARNLERQAENNNPTMLNQTYYERRKDLFYYKKLKEILMMVCRESDAILDVGSYGIDMLSFLPCKTKKSIDLNTPYSDDETEGIIGDYLEYKTEHLDVVTCYQVLEHIDDDKVVRFARKLLQDARMVIISVPYVWPNGFCKWHRQDPVSVNKLISWFGKNPVCLYKVTEANGLSRMIAVFVDGYNPDVDLAYWEEDAARTYVELIKRFENQLKERGYWPLAADVFLKVNI